MKAAIHLTMNSKDTKSDTGSDCVGKMNKAYIYLTIREYYNICAMPANKDVEWGAEATCYGIVLHMTEDNLAKFLYYLPLDHYLRSRFQRAGEGVFKW